MSAAPLPLKTATLFEHLDELRKRLMISLVFLAVGMSVAFSQRTALIELIKAPLSSSELYASGQVQVVTTKLAAQLLLSLNLSFWAGLALTLPFMLWQVWAFISPGLYPQERRWAVPFTVGAGLAFLGGVLFGYHLVLPAMVSFLVDFLAGAITPLLDLQEYIGTVTTFLVAFGLAFELPILAVLLTRIGLVNHGLLRGARRLAFVLVLVAAALITPTPDPGNMLLVAVPLYGLYELSVLLSWAFRVKDTVQDTKLTAMNP